MIKLGITGGIGSGKSGVISFLQILGIPTYIADDEAKRLMHTSSIIKASLIKHFGDDIFVDNSLNKNKLASLVFGNEQNLQLLNSIVHPVVANDFLCWCEQHLQCQCVAMEAAILFESGFDHFMDVIWTVYTPLEERIQRVMQRENVKYDSVIRRINSQISDTEKCKLANDVIYNKDTDAIIPQIEMLLKKYSIELC